ncbi:MAG TPA: site-2 protease family protein [Candidatus Sulfotelmatobacter sp.]
MPEPDLPLAVSNPEYLLPAVTWVERPKQRYWVHGLLLLLTCFTTLVMGARMQYNFQHNLPVFSLEDNSAPFFPWKWIFYREGIRMGFPFAATLMLILMAHEMGHYLYCKHYGVSATLPFFIPAPTLIGTLGAFIRIRSPIRSRTALFDIGIAGPIAGFVVAMVVLFVSLALSKPIGRPVQPGDLEIGFPLIFQLMHRVIASSGAAGVRALPLHRVLLHPTAIAAWVGMFATALNLLPGGQLDGGHIVFSIAPRAHKFVSRLTILILLPMAYFLWTGWLVWAVLLQLSSFRHPQVAEWPKVSGARSWLAALALLMLVLTLTPAPFCHASVPEVVRQFLGK